MLAADRWIHAPVIAFGTAITKPDVFRVAAEPGIRLAAEPDSEVLALPAVGSIFKSYNALLDAATAYADLEAFVLVHQDAELVDVDFCEKVRGVLRDPDVGVIGCAGAIDVRSIAWWEASITCASFTVRYEEHGGGDLPAFSWDWAEAPAYARTGEVETLDGFVLVLSPWAVHNVRFDESLGQFHGYDVDFCLQVRAAGRKVLTAEFRAIHYRPLELVPDPEEWIVAHMLVAEKWDERMPGIGAGVGSWKERTLRAEAERDVALVIHHSNALKRAARVLELERALAEATSSISWRITAPLRLPSKLASAVRLGRGQRRIPHRLRRWRRSQ